MKNIFLSLIILTITNSIAFSSQTFDLKVKAPNADFYRSLDLKIRTNAEFETPTLGIKSSIHYSYSWGTPAYKIPILSDISTDEKDIYFTRMFYDRIYTQPDSYIEINGEKLPLTCVFINGQDNRFSNKMNSPLLPDFVLKIYFVANDFSCQGPIKPGWPETGGRQENWDTYLYYEIRDPTIMLPTEAKLRYRWNETSLVLVDRGTP